MGNDSSHQLSQGEIQSLKNSTNFSTKEIQDWHDKFHQDFPDGVINKRQFIQMYRQMFPDGDASKFSEHIFRAYDVDGNGEIDFNEFLSTLSVSSKGSIDEKLKWAFRMYDLDGNGFVSRDEALEIITSIYKMRGESNCLEKAQDATDRIFIQLDKNKDDCLSEVEFIMAAKGSSAIKELLKTT